MGAQSGGTNPIRNRPLTGHLPPPLS